MKEKHNIVVQNKVYFLTHIQHRYIIKLQFKYRLNLTKDEKHIFRTRNIFRFSHFRNMRELLEGIQSTFLPVG